MGKQGSVGVEMSKPSARDLFGFVGSAGVEQDNTGLQMMGRRAYDPETGRFLTVDPFRRAGWLMPAYAYASGNPASLTDPEGDIIPFVLGAIAVGAHSRGLALRLEDSLRVRKKQSPRDHFLTRAGPLVSRPCS